MQINTIEEMTKFLKEQFLKNRELIHAAFNNLKVKQHLEVAFYRNGNVKILTIANGKDGRTYESIISICLDPFFLLENQIDERIIYGIESRVYKI